MKTVFRIFFLIIIVLALFGCNNGPNYTYKDYTGTYTFIPDPSNNLECYQLIMNGDRSAILNYYTNYPDPASMTTHAASITGNWPYNISYDSRVSAIGFYVPNRLGIMFFYSYDHAQFVNY